MNSKYQSEIANASKLVGSKQVLRAVREKTPLQVVYLADNADRELRVKIIAACEAASVEVRTFPTKEALGKLCGIERSCAVVGIT